MRQTLRCLMILAPLALTGCIAVAAGAGAAAGYSYVEGNAEGFVQAEPEQVAAAAQSAFLELGVEEKAFKHDEDDGSYVVAGKGPKEPVRVTVKPAGENASRLWVRVGRFGDEEFSRTVYERIRARL